MVLESNDYGVSGVTRRCAADITCEKERSFILCTTAHTINTTPGTWRYSGVRE
jgi:hypothetical protein